MKRNRKLFIVLIMLTVVIGFFTSGVKIEAASKKEEAKAKVSECSVILDGVTYQLPITFKDLSNHGWNTDGIAYWGDYPEDTTGCYLDKGETWIYVTVINISGHYSNSLDDYLITGVSASPDLLNIDDKINKDTSPTQLKKLLGEPYSNTGDAISDNTKENGCLYYNYLYEAHEEHSFYAVSTKSFRFCNGKLDNIQVESAFIDFEELLANGEVKPDTYKAPTKLGDNVDSETVRIAGNVYQLPVPVETMVEDGWTFGTKNELSEYILNTSTIKMKKGNLSVSVIVGNEETMMQKLENCYVYGVSVNSNTTASVVLPGYVKLGYTKRTVLKKYAKEDYKQIDRPTGKEQYEIYHMKAYDKKNKYRSYPANMYDGILRLNFESGKLTSYTYQKQKKTAIKSIDVKAKEKKVTIRSNKDAMAYFNYSCYSDQDSDWDAGGGTRSGVGLSFENGMFYSYNDGECDFSGDTPVPYTIDYKNNTIHLWKKDHTKCKDITYEILSSERFILNIDGQRRVYVTPYADLNLPEGTSYQQIIYVGEYKNLSYIGINSTSKFYNFESSDPKYATVTKTGKVKALKPGTTFISGKITQYGIVYPVTVRVDVRTPYLKFTKAAATMKRGTSQIIQATSYGLQGKITYSVNKTSGAIINKTTGRLVAKKSGTIIVTATCGNKVRKMKVTVK